MPRKPEDCIADFELAKSIRSPHENDWRLASAYCLQQHYGMWLTDGPTFLNNGTQLQALRRTVFDSTGMRSLPKYVAILERLLTPTGSKYQTIEADDNVLMKSYRVKAYFSALTELLFKRRNAPRAGFRSASNEVYASMGCYGTGPIFVGKRKPNALSRAPSMQYRARNLKDTFILTNEQGEVYKAITRTWLNLMMFKQEYYGEPLPPTLAREAMKPVPNSQQYVQIIQIVEPQPDFDPEAWDERRLPMVGYTVCVDDKVFVGRPQGFRSMPYLTPRTFTVAGDPYGMGPAVNAIASMAGASTVKKSYLKQGNMAAEPVVLAADDGIMNGTVDMRPGYVNYGAIDRQGRKLVGTLDPGRWDINAEILKEEQQDVEDSFFVTLFQILTETPEMTATEVLERVAEKAALLSPTMGRGQTEFLGPLTEREIDVFDEFGWLPEMPPELVEARGEYQIQYTSPMAKGMYAEEISGFVRAVEFATGIVEATQDPSHLDHFDFDTAIPEMADKTAVPARWLATPEALAAKREARDGQQQTQEAIQAAPGVAAVMSSAAKLQQTGAR